MRTPSHFLVTAVFSHRFHFNRIDSKALLLGSFLPDIPFALLTLFYEIYYRWFAPSPVATESIMAYLHFELFYTNPLWIVSHNFFHSLIINSLLLWGGYWGVIRNWRYGRPLFWLSSSMLFHTVIDIFTHHSDGPLLFFPLNLSYRFASPISYWEWDHYGLPFTIFEYLLNGFVLLYFFWKWRQTSNTGRSPARNQHS